MFRNRYKRLRLAHISLQFNDSARQKTGDLEKLFRRAKRKNWAWVTGTEAGGGSGVLLTYLPHIARQNGYRFYRPPMTDSWVAVRENLIDGDWETYWDLVIPGVAKQYTSKGVGAVKFLNNQLGMLCIIFCHLQTRGKNPGDPRYDQNWKLNKAIGAYALEAGKGTDLVFYGGDQNIVDRTHDTFMGEPLVSAWDELTKYQNTGHGNIDVLAKLKKDRRTEIQWIHALSDKKFFLHTDHFLVEAVYRIKKLRK